MGKSWYQVDRLSDGSYKMVWANNRIEAICLVTGSLIDNESWDLDLHATTRKDGNSLVVSWPCFSAEEYRATRIPGGSAPTK